MQVLEHDRRPGGDPDDSAERPSSSAGRERRVATVLILFALVLVVAHIGPRLAAPFGDSHDGQNAGVWASGARSLRERGPAASQLGAISPENGTYASHPPLLYVETAVAQLVSRSPAATRAPAWLGSLVALGLLAALLRERGLSPLAVTAGVAAPATSAMFLSYGAMLDTPVASLPFGIGLLLLWQRVRAGRRVSLVVTFLLAALAPLAGWQSLLVAAVVAGWGALRVVGGRRTGSEVALIGGAAAGAALLFAWLLWVGQGSLDFLVDQFRYRTAGSPSGTATSVGDLLAAQPADLRAMFGWGLLAVATVGMVVALRDHRTRALAAVALAATIPYTLAFRSGALNHSYWNYWWLLLVALGVATAVDRAVPVMADRLTRPALAPFVIGTVVVVLAVPALRLSPEEEVTRRGLAAGRLAASSGLAPEQAKAWYAGAVGEPAAWLGLATRRPVVPVDGQGITDLAARHPNDLVLVGEARCEKGQRKVVYSWRTATALAADPPVPSPCGE